MVSGDLPDVVIFKDDYKYVTNAIEANLLVNLDEHQDALPNAYANAINGIEYFRDNVSLNTGVAYAIPVFFFLKNAPKSAEVVEVERPSAVRAVSELMTNKYFIMMIIYFTLPGLAGWVIKDWLPAILQDQFNIGQGKAGVSATIYVNIAAIVGAIIGGTLADRWMKRSIRGRIYISAIGMSLIIPALFGVGYAFSLFMAVCFLIVFGIGWGFFDCNNMPILCQIVRPELRATGYGILNLVGISCGGFADWSVGFMRDHGIPTYVIFSVFACLCITSATLVLLIRPNRNLVR